MRAGRPMEHWTRSMASKCLRYRDTSIITVSVSVNLKDFLFLHLKGPL